MHPGFVVSGGLGHLCFPVEEVDPTPVRKAALDGKRGIADSLGFDDPKVRIWSIASGQEPAHSAIQCRQASRSFPCKRQEVGAGHLTMPGDLHDVGKRRRHAIDVI